MEIHVILKKQLKNIQSLPQLRNGSALVRGIMIRNNLKETYYARVMLGLIFVF